MSLDSIPPEAMSSSAHGLGAWAWSSLVGMGGVGALSLHGLGSCEEFSECRVCKESRGGGFMMRVTQRGGSRKGYSYCYYIHVSNTFNNQNNNTRSLRTILDGGSATYDSIYYKCLVCCFLRRRRTSSSAALMAGLGAHWARQISLARLFSALK